MSRRFRYGLEPVRLQRSWQAADLRTQLAAHNVRLAGQEEAVQALDRESAALHEEWRAMAATAWALQVGTLAAYSTYLARLQGQAAAARQVLEALQREREDLLAGLAQATRELDAVERHKADERRKFWSGEESMEAKNADDHWSILRMRGRHGDQA